MNTFTGSVSLCVTTLLLSACATSGPGSSSASKVVPAAPAASTTQAAAAAPSTASAGKIPASYTAVQRGGAELYCRKEKVPGSRAKVEEVCLTKAQLDAQEANVNNTLQRMRDTPVDKSAMDSSGGRSNSVMSH
jgi:hypothetical protein